MEKPWFTSKVIWVNVFALVAAILQAKLGLVAPPEWQMIFLTVVNIVLRTITKSGLTE